MKFINFIKGFIMVLVFLFLLVIFFDILPVAVNGATKPNPWIVSENQKPLIIPHGGAKETYPENTLYAFENTSQYDAFEIDLALTKDGFLISHHDLDLGLTANSPETMVRDLTYDEIINAIVNSDFPHVRNFNGTNKKESYTDYSKQELIDMGLIPAKLQEIFTKYPDKLYILEIKDVLPSTVTGAQRTKMRKTSEAAIKELVKQIEDFKMENQVIMASFDDSVVTKFIKLTDNKIPTATGSLSTGIFGILSYLKLDAFYYTKHDGFSLPYNEIAGEGTLKIAEALPGFLRNIIFTTYGPGKIGYNLQRKNIVSDAHRKGMAVIYWTVNDKSEMEELIARGVDGIITDNPDLLYSLLYPN